MLLRLCRNVCHLTLCSILNLILKFLECNVIPPFVKARHLILIGKSKTWSPQVSYNIVSPLDNKNKRGTSIKYNRKRKCFFGIIQFSMIQITERDIWWQKKCLHIYSSSYYGGLFRRRSIMNVFLGFSAPEN